MDRDTLDARQRLLTVLWGALLGGVTMFAGVAWALASGLLSGEWSPGLSAGVAAPILLATPVMLAAGMFLRKGEPSRTAEGAGLLDAHQTRALVAWAVQEGGALLGITVSLLAGQPTWIGGVWAVSAVAMALTRPHREELDALFRVGR